MARGMMSVAALALALSLSGPVLAKKATSKAMTCPACHMAVTTKKTKTNTRAFKVGGKTYYCCAGCNMKVPGATGSKTVKGGK